MNAPDSNSDNANNRITTLLLDIHKLSDAYLQTKFTEDEDMKFDELVRTLNELEPSRLNSIQVKSENANHALVLLNELSAIQVEESKLIMDYAEKLYISGKASSEFAFAIILVNADSFWIEKLEKSSNPINFYNLEKLGEGKDDGPKYCIGIGPTHQGGFYCGPFFRDDGALFLAYDYLLHPDSLHFKDEVI